MKPKKEEPRDEKQKRANEARKVFELDRIEHERDTNPDEVETIKLDGQPYPLPPESEEGSEKDEGSE